MKAELTNQQSEEFFYNALCNAVGTAYIDGLGLELKTDPIDFQEAKKALSAKPNGDVTSEICYEDILMKILHMNRRLTLVDHEGGMPPAVITISDVHERVNKMPEHHLTDMINEHDDADTASALIQTVFYNEVVFG